MKKTLFLISFIFMCMLFPMRIKAYCTFKDKSQLMKQASNISTAYVFDENSKTFSIIMNNIPNSFTIVDVKNDQQHDYSSHEITLQGYQPGSSYQFEVRVTNEACFNEHLRTIYITLPVYNLNYNSTLCKGLEEYSICQKWGIYIKDPTEFKKEIKKIQKKEIEANEKETTTEKTSILTQFVQTIQKYYYIEIPVIVILVFMIIYKRNKKEKLL